jgi:hypothetical protein
MFDEQNVVEDFIVSLLCGPRAAGVRERRPPYGRSEIALETAGLGWTYVPAAELPRAPGDVLVEPSPASTPRSPSNRTAPTRCSTGCEPSC